MASPLPNAETIPRDFVFLDSRGKLYRVRELEGSPWLHYWQDDRWVSLRKLRTETARAYALFALPTADAAPYAGGVAFLVD
jgi:hypothetical protein